MTELAQWGLSENLNTINNVKITGLYKVFDLKFVWEEKIVCVSWRPEIIVYHSIISEESNIGWISEIDPFKIMHEYKM